MVLFILFFGGPIQITTTHNGSKYFVISINDFYKYTIVYLFFKNSNFWDIQQLVEKQLGKRTKILKINNGGEYKTFEFNQFC